MSNTTPTTEVRSNRQRIARMCSLLMTQPCTYRFLSEQLGMTQEHVVLNVKAFADADCVEVAKDYEHPAGPGPRPTAWQWKVPARIFDRLQRDRANSLLNRVRAGDDVDVAEIREALRITGDLDGHTENEP
jgi:hypothetical protein